VVAVPARVWAAGAQRLSRPVWRIAWPRWSSRAAASAPLPSVPL